MGSILPLLAKEGQAAAMTPGEAEPIAARLGEVVRADAYVSSITVCGGVLYFLTRDGIEKRLHVVCGVDDMPEAVADFQGDSRVRQADGDPVFVKTCELSHVNALALRKHLPFTAPQVMGVQKAAGLGDRLGLATPGHVRAVRGTDVIPFFAQQSIREMTRTQRTADEVMDDATWGVLQEGWLDGFGSDADHLKTIDDVNVTVDAGFTMFTIDPGDHVDNEADAQPASQLAEKFGALPWHDLETSASDCRAGFAGQTFHLGSDVTIAFSDEQLLRAAAKYAKAVAHTARLYRHLASRMDGKPFELEMSVDETLTPTAIHEHYYVASELKRLGVEWVSLAPRFVGDFEKGVDYKGDLGEFERTFAQHVAIAREFGPYKISLHSGSDKFSVYPVAARLAGDLVHVKTAGTSYLEALRAIGRVEPSLFREILAFAFERYETDKASYHVSADPAKVPQPDDLRDAELEDVLDLFDGRQLLHVTFGSVLTAEDDDGSSRFRESLMRCLRENEEVYYEVLEVHLGKHVQPFAAQKEV